jgi:nicotinamidase-related amidase
MASYDPHASRARQCIRLSEQKKAETAILFIDVQAYTCSRSSILYTSQPQKDFDYFFNRIDTVCRGNWKLLAESSRKAGIAVFSTAIQSLRQDGLDRSKDYVLSGFHVPPECDEARLLPEIRSEDPNEICFPKTSSSVFNSTTINYVLRNMGINSLIVCGCLTDQCVDHAIRDGCDLGYMIFAPEDACATFSEERHHSAVAAFAGYCQPCSTAQVVEELSKI